MPGLPCERMLMKEGRRADDRYPVEEEAYCIDLPGLDRREPFQGNGNNSCPRGGVDDYII